MNTAVSKTDFIYFQDEVLKDIKNLEIKFNEKSAEMTKNINETKSSTETNIKKLYGLLVDVSEKLEHSEEIIKLSSQLTTFQKKLEDFTINSRIKTNTLEKEINNMTIKYDKIFINNLMVPRLIGNSCPYPSLSNFIENANKKINDLITEKKKQGMDLKSYKDKLENIIGQFNVRINGIEEQFKKYCNNCFINYDKNSNERYNAIEDKMNTLRMENVKYSSELIERSNELKMEWDKIQEIRKEIYDKFDSELSKYSKLNIDLIKSFESQKSEFTLIKSRFTELSDFIKDVRFRNNLTNINKNIANKNKTTNSNTDANANNTNSFAHMSYFQKKVKFNRMSKRINFKLKQKLDDSIKSKPDLHKSNKELNKFVEFQEKKEDSVNHSFAKTVVNFNENDNYSDVSETKSENKREEKEKKDYIINKPIDTEKVKSTLTSYFNSNKGYKGHITNRNKLLPIYPAIKIKNTPEKNEQENKKNKSVINHESDQELSVEEEKIKSILNKKNKIKSAKNKNLSRKENTKTQSDIEEGKLSPRKLNKSKGSPKRKKTKKNQFNKNIKLSSEDKKLIKEKEKYKVSTFVNSPKNNINILENNKDNNKDNIILLSLEKTKTDNKNENNNNRLSSKTITKINSPAKIDPIYSDKSDFSNNYKESESKKNLIANHKFSFLTDTNINNIKKSSKNEMMKTIESNNPINYRHIKTNEESMNLNFAILNKKIIKTNNRLTELHFNSDQKINKIYQYVKKVFDHLSGIFFFKDLYNQKFNFDYSPKTLMTQTDFTSTFPTQKYNKTKIILKGENKYFSQDSLKKPDTYKTLVDRIEPYLIKKFKE